MELAGYLFALFYLFHALIGVFVLGFIFGKITQKRFASKKLIHSLWLAVFTFVVIFIIGGLDGIFSQMQFRSHQTTIDDFIFGISHPDTHYFAIGTFCSFESIFTFAVLLHRSEVPRNAIAIWMFQIYMFALMAYTRSACTESYASVHMQMI